MSGRLLVSVFEREDDVVQATILLVLVATPVIRRLLRLRGTPAAIEAAPTITKSYSGETVVR